MAARPSPQTKPGAGPRHEKAQKSVPGARHDSGVIIKSSDGDHFLPAPGLLPECFAGALQRVDPINGGAVFLIKSEHSKCLVPWHWHSSNEQITVVSGIVFIQMRNGKTFNLGAGGYAFLPSRHIHLFGCSGPCVHFVQSEGPFNIHYVDAAGKEIPLSEALKLETNAAAN